MAEPVNKIEDIDKVYVKPSGDGENVSDPNAEPEGEAAEGSGDGEGDGESEGASAGNRHPKEEIIDNSHKQKPPAQAGEGSESADGSAAGAASEGKGKTGPDGLRDVNGETPTERALRGELAIARSKLRQERKEELGLDRPAAQAAAAPAQAAASQEVLKKYKPAEIAAFREVQAAIAEEMGYVKAADLSQQAYASQSQQVLDDFLSAHKEYLPENDREGVLWGAFKQEFGLYQKPANPKDFQKIFNRIHTAIFGIMPAGDRGAINAAQQKINVASHAGASGPSRTERPARASAGTPGLRLDMLRGFDDDEKEGIAGRG